MGLAGPLKGPNVTNTERKGFSGVEGGSSYCLGFWGEGEQPPPQGGGAGRGRVGVGMEG
jgi:hypothetical protein